MQIMSSTFKKNVIRLTAFSIVLGFTLLQIKLYFSNERVHILPKISTPNIHFLRKFSDQDAVSRQIFFAETSGATYLSGRQCCAIESAYRTSDIKVNVLLTPKFLNTSLSNCTFQLMTSYYPQITFYVLNTSDLFRGLPIEGLEKRFNYSDKWDAILHSDLVRVALIYKYGGMYSDLDTVFVRNVDLVQNFVSTQDGKPRDRSQCL